MLYKLTIIIIIIIIIIIFIIKSGLRLERHEVLSLGHYLRVQSRRHYTIDGRGDRDVEKG